MCQVLNFTCISNCHNNVAQLALYPICTWKKMRLRLLLTPGQSANKLLIFSSFGKVPMTYLSLSKIFPLCRLRLFIYTCHQCPLLRRSIKSVLLPQWLQCKYGSAVWQFHSLSSSCDSDLYSNSDTCSHGHSYALPFRVLISEIWNADLLLSYWSLQSFQFSFHSCFCSSSLASPLVFQVINFWYFRPLLNLLPFQCIWGGVVFGDKIHLT